MSPTRRLLSLVLVSGLFSAFVSTTGCSRQKEGERCALLNGNADCDSSELFCTPASTLRGGEDLVDRCCLHPEIEPNDSRCEVRTTVIGDGDSGAGGGGGIGGSNSGDDGNGLGKACQWKSDCAAELICGPGGICMPECQKDIDCPADQICDSEQICVAKK